MSTKNDTTAQPIKRLVLNRERVRNFGLKTGVRTGAIVVSSGGWGGNSAGSAIGPSSKGPPISDSVSGSEFSVGSILIGG